MKKSKITQVNTEDGLYLTTLTGITVIGSAADDNIAGTEGRDSLLGGGGNDELLGLRDDDFLSGDDGNDRLYGDRGNDTMIGGAGNDYIIGFDLSYFTEESGITLSAGNDLMLGGDGNDRIEDVPLLYAENFFVGTNNDTILGGNGDDTIIAYEYWDVPTSYSISGGSGQDSIVVRDDSFDNVTTILGDAGNDIIDAAQSIGNLYIDSGSDHDQIGGGRANDTISAGDGLDVVSGGDGFDRIFGGAGADTLWGDNGNDLLRGDAGDDRLDGGSGNDDLSGGAGTDYLIGGAGDDILYGQGGGQLDSGSDTFVGGYGNDQITLAPGGIGSFVISFDGVATRAGTIVGTDNIVNFQGDDLSGGNLRDFIDISSLLTGLGYANNAQSRAFGVAYTLAQAADGSINVTVDSNRDGSFDTVIANVIVYAGTGTLGEDNFITLF